MLVNNAGFKDGLKACARLAPVTDQSAFDLLKISGEGKVTTHKVWPAARVT